MSEDTPGWLDRVVHRRSLALWRRVARGAAMADLAALRRRRQQARQLRAHLDAVIHVAEGRLAKPRIGSDTFQRPGGTLWSWRPQLWRGPLAQKGTAAAPSKTPLGDEVTLFHDCTIPELTLRQLRNSREEDLAPFGLRLEVFRFDGSFLSLVLDLPPEAGQGLQRRHLFRMSSVIETEKPVEVFARLNIKHGPNTEQLVQELAVNQDEVVIEFDLAFSEIHENRIENLWLDLIFEGPEMNQITVRDITMCRYPRAEI